MFNLPDRVDSIKISKLNDIKESSLAKYDYLAIDEAQFYPDLCSFVKKNLKNGKYIHCAGLMTDHRKEPFGEFYKIVHLAAEATLIKAYCVKCRSLVKTGVFTKKIHDDMASSCVVDPGGSEKYVPVCAHHY